MKLCIYPTSSTADLYQFKMSLFRHGDPEEFLLFVSNFNMTLAETWMLETDAKIQYLCMLVRVESLRRFEVLSSDVESIETLNVE